MEIKLDLDGQVSAVFKIEDLPVLNRIVKIYANNMPLAANDKSQTYEKRAKSHICK